MGTRGGSVRESVGGTWRDSPRQRGQLNKPFSAFTRDAESGAQAAPPADKISDLRTDNPTRGGEGTVSPGSPPPPPEKSVSGWGDPARRATPLTTAGIVALYGLLAVALGVVWPGGLPAGVAAALVVALGVVVVTVYLLSRRAGVATATADGKAAELARREALLRLEVEGTGVALGLIDASWRWIAVNDSLASITGRDGIQLKATTLPAITAADHVTTLENALADLRSGAAASWRGEGLQLRANGGAVPVAIAVSPASANGSGPLYLVEETDVSAIKRAEALRDALAAVRHTVATSATW